MTSGLRTGKGEDLSLKTTPVAHARSGFEKESSQFSEVSGKVVLEHSRERYINPLFIKGSGISDILKVTESDSKRLSEIPNMHWWKPPFYRCKIYT
jgi:hypothetical protein